MRFPSFLQRKKNKIAAAPEIKLSLMTEDDYSRVEQIEIYPNFRSKTSDFSSNWSGKSFGPTPSWWSPDLDLSSQRVCRLEVERVFYFPSSGAIVTEDGFILPHTYHQAKYAYEDMLDLREQWPRRSKAVVFEDAAVTVGWGAIHNYGHFLLDTLTSVPVLGKMQYVTPPLKKWQQDHFESLGIVPDQLHVECCFIQRAIYTTNMRAVLHEPNAAIDKALSHAQLAAIPRTYNGSSRLYISRRGQKRPCISEPAIEQALADRGFNIVRPETLSVAEQIDIFNSADVIVATTGAALANVLYAKSGVRVIEILPKDMTLDNYAHKWVAYLTAFAGGDWRPFFCDDVEGAARPEVGGEQRMGYLPFDLDVDELLNFIFASD